MKEADFGFNRGTFRVRGDNSRRLPCILDEGIRIEIGEDKIKSVEMINP